MIRAALLAIVLAAASLTLAQDAEDELIIVPRSEVRAVIAELNRLRDVEKNLRKYLLACHA